MQILSMVISLAVVSNLVGCKGLEPAPVKFIWEYIVLSDECLKYEVVSQDPLKVSDGVLVAPGECPQSVMGFSTNLNSDGSNDATNMFNWIRNAQENAKKKLNKNDGVK